jgi:hypothetical protein
LGSLPHCFLVLLPPPWDDAARRPGMLALHLGLTSSGTARNKETPHIEQLTCSDKKSKKETNLCSLSSTLSQIFDYTSMQRIKTRVILYPYAREREKERERERTRERQRD